MDSDPSAPNSNRAASTARARIARNAAPPDGVDLRELWSLLIEGKWWIAAFVFAFTTVSIVYALLQPNVYEAEVVLAPAVIEDAEGLAGLAGQLGGLASLAGINLGGSSTDKTTLALEVLESRAFIHDFVRRRDILPQVMAAEEWDPEQGWTLDADLYDPAQRKWVREVDPPKTQEPSSFEIAKAVRRHVLGLSQDDETGIVRLRVRSLSPVAAQQWATWLVEDLNMHMRAMDIAEAEKSIGYLRDQIEKTAVAEMQNVFYGLIEQQTRTMMLAQVRDDYIFKTVDPAIVPDEKASPKRALIAVLGLLLGLMFGAVLVLVRGVARGDAGRGTDQVSSAS